MMSRFWLSIALMFIALWLSIAIGPPVVFVYWMSLPWLAFFYKWGPTLKRLALDMFKRPESDDVFYNMATPLIDHIYDLEEKQQEKEEYVNRARPRWFDADIKKTNPSPDQWLGYYTYGIPLELGDNDPDI